MPAEHVTFEPEGYRDVYWCWNLNEPAMLYTAADDVSRCWSCCNWPLENTEEGMKAFLAYHTFVCHILKPREA